MPSALRIDLHCHSNYSDGALSPDELLKKALNARLDLLALTDHDTVSGLPALQQAAADKPIRIIPGIELSVRWKLHEIHLLGLNIDITHPALQRAIESQKQRRCERALKIAQLLEAQGIEKVYEKACQVAGHNRLSRPHFAQVLVDEKIVPHMQAAFSRFLRRGKPAYVITEWLSLEDATKVVLAAGGTPVIAHPSKYKLTRSKLKALIDAFKAAGGQGIEVVSSLTSPLEIQTMATLAKEEQLLASSGSDFHHEQSMVGLGQQAAMPLDCKPVWESWSC